MSQRQEESTAHQPAVKPHAAKMPWLQCSWRQLRTMDCSHFFGGVCPLVLDAYPLKVGVYHHMFSVPFGDSRVSYGKWRTQYEHGPIYRYCWFPSWQTFKWPDGRTHIVDHCCNLILAFWWLWISNSMWPFVMETRSQGQFGDTDSAVCRVFSCLDTPPIFWRVENTNAGNVVSQVDSYALYGLWVCTPT